MTSGKQGFVTPTIPLSWRVRWGLLRSILIYYGRPLRLWQQRNFYAQFIPPGGLCFDLGSHVGNRLLLWSWLGTQIVAVEPQPQCMQLLRRWYGNRANIELVEAAVGEKTGQAALFVSERTPTVSTLSQTWLHKVQAVDSFAQVKWESTVNVPVVTLDMLIEHYGEPCFCKIDVEGYELAVLQGLSQPLAALSFEYIPAVRDDAIACVEQLAALGAYEYNWSISERHRWQSKRWLAPESMIKTLAGLAENAQSGDVYARRVEH